MKITLPNGIIIEAEQGEDVSSVLNLMNGKSDAKRHVDSEQKEDLPPVAEPPIIPDKRTENLLNSLTDTQRYTWYTLRKMGKSHRGAIADALGISSSAVTQRMKVLKDLGLVERVGHACFKVTPFQS